MWEVRFYPVYFSAALPWHSRLLIIRKLRWNFFSTWMSFYSLGYLEEASKLKQVRIGSTCVCVKAQAPPGGNNVLLLLLKNATVEDEVVRVEWCTQLNTKQKSGALDKDLAWSPWNWLLSDLQQLGFWALWLSNLSLILRGGEGRRGRLRHLLILSILTTQEYDEELLRYMLSALNSLNKDVL